MNTSIGKNYIRLAIISFDNQININMTKFFPDVYRMKIINNITKRELPDKILSISNKYDIILIVKGNENLTDKWCSIKYYKGMDSVGGDLEQCKSNPLEIINNMIKRPDYLAVNSLGYVKSKVNKIEKNYHLRFGGLWVKTEEKSKIYISNHCLSLINILDLEFFNILKE